ncbi:MAG: LytR C-terminal domain-containing protein [Demequinaceae bacterium]|nr:LytR C-terminal domain-containing protein [Demequinaceae bacterium]
MTDKQRPSTTTLRTRRELLRRRRRERQFLVYGTLVCAMGAAAFSAYNIYTGKVEGPFARPYITNAGGFSSEITLPCPPSDSYPLPESEVLVRVRNSTDKQGLASTALTDLVGRGFQSGGANNFEEFVFDGTARIVFGVNGVQEGYTVARHFEDPVLVLDSRNGAGVDVILGTQYDRLVPLYSTDLDPTLILTAPAECLPASLISPILAPSRYPVPSAAPTVEVTVSPAIVDEPGGD